MNATSNNAYCTNTGAVSAIAPWAQDLRVQSTVLRCCCWETTSQCSPAHARHKLFSQTASPQLTDSETHDGFVLPPQASPLRSQLYGLYCTLGMPLASIASRSSLGFPCAFVWVLVKPVSLLFGGTTRSRLVKYLNLPQFKGASTFHAGSALQNTASTSLPGSSLLTLLPCVRPLPTSQEEQSYYELNSDTKRRQRDGWKNYLRGEVQRCSPAGTL